MEILVITVTKAENILCMDHLIRVLQTNRIVGLQEGRDVSFDYFLCTSSYKNTVIKISIDKLSLYSPSTFNFRV